MSDITTSSSGWVQFYEQSFSEHSTSSSFRLSDSTMIATNCGLDSISPNNSSVASGQSNLTDRGHKPIRKRSRASKKAPATLLNAKPTNFRALVQQFTGCPSRNVSFSGQKGPVNLNFQLGKVQDHGDASTIMASSGGSYNYDHQPISQIPQPPQVQRYQQQQCTVSVSGVSVAASSSGDACLPTLGDSTAHGLKIPAGGFSLDDFPLHELYGEPFPEKLVNEDFF